MPVMPQITPDHILVQECLRGSEDAWSALVEKYKNLIFSIPLKYGFTEADATDIFQSVFLALLAELPRLREPRALPSWLIETTSHKCYHIRLRAARQLQGERQAETIQAPQLLAEQALHQIEREQILRESLLELSPDCKHLVDLLFFPPRRLNYDEIAKFLGIPKGSIGPTRMRCLEKLRLLLKDKGF